MSEARDLYREGFQHFVDDRLGEAIETYRRALDLDPNLAIAWNGLSMALKRKGDLPAAIESAKKLIELEPDDPLSHTNLSILYMSHGMIQEAEDEKALAMKLEQQGST